MKKKIRNIENVKSLFHNENLDISLLYIIVSSLVLPECLENIPLVPVYQRAVLRAAWAQVWEWAVGELRAHVLKAEQHCVAAHSTGRLLKGRDNPTYKDSNLSCRDHNILASMPLSRYVLIVTFCCYFLISYFVITSLFCQN